MWKEVLCLIIYFYLLYAFENNVNEMKNNRISLKTPQEMRAFFDSLFQDEEFKKEIGKEFTKKIEDAQIAGIKLGLDMVRQIIDFMKQKGTSNLDFLLGVMSEYERQIPGQEEQNNE